MEIATGMVLWYPSLIPPVAIHWMLIRDPQGQYEPMALLCTDQQAEAVQMVVWFVLRWTVEVTFHEVRVHLNLLRDAFHGDWNSPSNHKRDDYVISVKPLSLCDQGPARPEYL